jgi:hypothetical protein
MSGEMFTISAPLYRASARKWYREMRVKTGFMCQNRISSDLNQSSADDVGLNLPKVS